MSDGTPYNIIVKPDFSYDGGVPVSGHGKVASRNEDGLAHVPLYTSMVTYITTYKAISTRLIGWVPSPAARRGFCWFLALEP